MHAKYRAENPEKVRAATAKWRAENPERARAASRGYRRRKAAADKFGQSLVQFAEMREIVKDNLTEAP